MQSEAASESSPAAGPAKKRPAKKAARDENRQASFETTFDGQASKHLIAAVIHVTIGVLLIVALGTVAKVIGAILVGLAAIRAVRFFKRVTGADGRISITPDSVKLPATLTTKHNQRTTYDKGELASVFYLRRSLPWFRSSPILVVETSGKNAAVYRYPRDWFATDSDQRRVAEALARHVGSHVPSSLIAESEPADEQAESSARTRRNRALGFFIATGGLVMMANLGFTFGRAGFVVPSSVLYIGAGACFVTGVYNLLVLPTPDNK